jgi:hypothetical protein
MFVYEFNILRLFVSFRLLMLSSNKTPLILQDFVISMPPVNVTVTNLHCLQFLNYTFLDALCPVRLNL